jgi:hypothetical protein
MFSDDYDPVAHVLNSCVLKDILEEADRAHAHHGDNSMMNATASNERRLAILTEEVGEVARELNEASIHGTLDELKLYKELQQTAAMAASWMAVLHA